MRYWAGKGKIQRTDGVSPPWVEAGRAEGWGGGGMTVRRRYRAGEVSTEHVRSGEDRRMPGTKGGRHMAVCFSSLLSRTPFSLLCSFQARWSIGGGGQHRTGGGALLSEIPFFALQFLSVMWQGMGGCVGWAVSNVSQDWAEVRATEA